MSVVYCFDITGDVSNQEEFKKKVEKLYTKKKFNIFESAEELPFIIIYSKTDKRVCIQMVSRSKKNIEKLEEIHKKFKKIDLNLGDNVLGKPYKLIMEQCTWWEKEESKKSNVKWKTLSHNGPYFTHIIEPYEAHKVPILYGGKKYMLTQAEERIANFYAQRLTSEEAGTVSVIWTKDSVFNNNFWSDFKKYLTAEHAKIFKNFKDFNFSKIVEHFKNKKKDEKAKTTAEKRKKKEKLLERKAEYGYAMINGIKEPIGNFIIEPAAIFYGRGENPNRGKIKRDIEPEEVTINVEDDVEVLPPKGHKWLAVVHDNTASWLATWKDPILEDNKYMWFSAEGQIKGKSDMLKYEKARKLNKYLSTVQKKYKADINSNVVVEQQLGTVLYLIDNFGFRVGNEKDESETDTVGASTLRVEHLKLKSNNTIAFDFLGKDSIRYFKEISVDNGVYKNLKEFISGKDKTDLIFDKITSTSINDYLKTFDETFSAKIFRTRLASSLMYDSLGKIKIPKKASQSDKKREFISANSMVAEVLNHRKTAPTKTTDILTKYKGELKELKKEMAKKKHLEKDLTAIKKRIQTKRNQIEIKANTLNVAITTSLTNYIDPRIVISWSKKTDTTISQIYSGVLQKKFRWAIDTTDKTWDYKIEPLKGIPEKLHQKLTEDCNDERPISHRGPRPQKKAGKPPLKKAGKPPFKKAGKPPFKSQTSRPPIQYDAMRNFKQVLLFSPVEEAKIVYYSEKSIVVFDFSSDIYSYLMSTKKARYNPFLTILGEKKKGLIYASTNYEDVVEILTFYKMDQNVPNTSPERLKLLHTLYKDPKVDRIMSNIPNRLLSKMQECLQKTNAKEMFSPGSIITLNFLYYLEKNYPKIFDDLNL